MSSSAGDDESPSRIVHSLEHVESVESMDTSEIYNSDPELIINTGSDQSPDSEMIVPFVSREEESEQRSVPTCSKDAEVEDFQAPKHDVNEFREKTSVNSDANMNLESKDMEIPKPGTPVSSKAVKKAGPYILGPVIGSSPVQSIVQCLARKEGTDKFYTIKILTLKDSMEQETQDDRQGKMLLHSEYSLLSLLQNQDGVVHHHGFFKDCALEEKVTRSGAVYTGRTRQRLCLILDCLICHDFNPNSDELINLQHYVIREKKLSEKESLLIFFDTVRIVACLHKKNIVHRDLKLGNLVLNRRTRKVTITNFCLGKHLSCENDLLKDQRGSPAYISPDVLCGKPYLGKPSDMWALGVVLYTMLFGQFPFYDSSPSQLFNKIKAANYYMPSDGRVSDGTVSLIRSLLVLQPNKRLTAMQVLDSLTTIIATFKVPVQIGEDEDEQVVPDIENNVNEEESDKKPEKKEEVSSSRMKILTDFSKQVTIQEQMHQMMKQQPSPLVSRPKPYSQIPVYRVDSDAREMTPAELDKFKHLLPRDNQRPHPYNPGNRGEGILLRVRGCLRNRSSPGNQVNIQTRDYSVSHRSLPSSSGSSSSSNVQHNAGNAMNDRLVQPQVHSSSNPTPQPAPRPDSNSVSNLRLGTRDMFLFDFPSRLPANFFNEDYNRMVNPSSQGSNHGTWTPLAAQLGRPLPTNTDESHPINQDPPNDQPGNNNSNITLRHNNRVLTAPPATPGPSNGTQSSRNPSSSVNISNESNRPHVQHQNQPSRVRSSVVDWYPPFISQQSQIDAMERSMLPRRLSLGHSRHSPYFTNFRQMNMRSLYQSNNVRRTNSDSNLGRSLETNSSSRSNEILVPNVTVEHIPQNLQRQISIENLAQRANLLIGSAFRERSRDGPSLSNDALASTMNTLRRNLAMRLLSAVSESQQEQNNDRGAS
ncbi:probable serine/threonine-protein kinase DDB_G0277165 [Nasonia vitripennis]|uniref:Serine/threonine-protein kinase 40 n=1 Tax=Nasonia vitripennis TaxID=7425 RepID=A0A7M7H7U8_NASVI|nr:probable serine/threonine-protein kinase DDB_G0277165 [Nasonia vitripennis]XP_008202986.1 probable serine/threonine-protein kinase DDB_G0277165 [Nasonia vitripennis]